MKEHLRQCTNNLKYTDSYLCLRCLCKNPVMTAMRAEAIKIGLSAIPYEVKSQRSKDNWKNAEYRTKCCRPKTDLERAKVSATMLKKFQEDAIYISKIKSARKQYWDNAAYRQQRLHTLNDFIAASMLGHGDRYDYSSVNYIDSKTKVTIICKKHGPFQQRPSHHIHYLNGCPQCAREIETSRPQQEIYDWLSGLNVAGPITLNDTTIVNNYELDIYIPKYKLAIEYHGGFYHSFGKLETTMQRYKHHRKASAAVAAGVDLLQFWEVEWTYAESKVKSIISHKLHLSKRIGARQCVACKIDAGEAKCFFTTNHLQGHKPSKLYIGLKYDSQLVAAVAISSHNKYDYELVRYANCIGMGVTGGLSKLLSFASKSIHGSLFSYADRRYSPQAAGYLASGFSHIGITKPGYFYWHNNKMLDRRRFQKHKLSKILKVFDPKLTEAENMFLNGYRRMWDAGHHRLIRNL